jgi:phosphate butyryltransferase
MLKALEDLVKRAKLQSGKKVMAVAAAEDDFVLDAVSRFEKSGLLTPVYFGDKSKIFEQAYRAHCTIPDDSLIQAGSYEEAASMAVAMVKSGKANLLMKGILPTQLFLKAIVCKENGIVDDKILSHLAVFESPFYHKLFGLTDAAMNIDPDIDMKIKIISNAVYAFKRIAEGIPNVALLAAIEKVNPKMKSTTDADYLVKQHLSQKICECILEGPMALDVAISETAAHHKGISSVVAGNVDILVAPEMTSANILYKSLTYLGAAKAASVLLGAKVPVILTSRADSPESKYYSIALALCLSE